MEVYPLWAEDGALAGFEDRGGWFQEEEGFLGAGIVELFYMISFGVSAGGAKSTLGRRQRRAVGEREGERGAYA